MQTIYEKLCEKLLVGCCSVNWEMLVKYINEIQKNSVYTIDDILDEFFDMYYKNKDSYELMYVVLLFYEKTIKDKMIKFYPKLENKILEYKINKHINYLDSYLNDECWWYDLKEYNKKEVVDEVLEKWGILEKGGKMLISKK